jgi:hypothetical protein
MYLPQIPAHTIQQIEFMSNAISKCPGTVYMQPNCTMQSSLEIVRFPYSPNVKLRTTKNEPVACTLAVL